MKHSPEIANFDVVQFKNRSQPLGVTRFFEHRESHVFL